MSRSEKRSKVTYVPPILLCEIIEMEGSIAASSATIIPGGGEDLFFPNVEEWQSEVRENEILF